MNTDTFTSRVESLATDFRGADWERRLGRWTITLLALAATWWFVQRLQNTVGAVLGKQELPEMWQGIGDMISAVLFFPLSNFVMILYAAMTYCFAVGLYRAASRWYTADSPWRRFVLLYGLAGLLIPVVGMVLVNVAGVTMHIAGGADLESALRTLDWSVIGSWPVDFLPAAVVVAAVASWRRDEFELTARRRQALAVAAVVIVVAPAVLGAVGVGVTTADDSRQDPLRNTNVTAADLDDGYSGPDLEELEASDLERGSYQPASALLDDWTSNRVHADDSEWGDSAAGMTGAWGESRNTGTLSLENVRSATVVIDVVSPDGEIVRVHYRLCRPDAEVGES